jgi:hypothetical protein
MKKIILLLSAASIFIISCRNTKSDTKDNTIAKETIAHPKIPKAEGAPRILFVGNSHTEYYTSMPLLFDELCKASNQPMNIDKLVTMGVAINEIYEDHKKVAEAYFAKKDADGNYYDLVVLQEKTPTALQEPETYKANVKMILEKIRKNSPGAAVYIYEGMSPLPFTDEQFNPYYEEMRKNALEVMKTSGNAGLLRVGDAVKEAYEGKNSYNYIVAGKDNLRFGTNTLHLLNDGGYMQAILLYATIFDKMPTIPAELTLSTGTGDNDNMKKQPVANSISNPKALEAIAFSNR